MPGTWPQNRRLLGTRVNRVDGPEKATGRAKYSYDINRPGMIHARILRCPHAHASVTAIDDAAARQVPGFRAIHMIARPNAELLYAGAEILAIAADTEEHAEDCLRAVNVTYQVLPHLVKETDALAAQQSTVGGARNVGNRQEFATQNFADQAYQNVNGDVSTTLGAAV